MSSSRRSYHESDESVLGSLTSKIKYLAIVLVASIAATWAYADQYPPVLNRALTHLQDVCLKNGYIPDVIPEAAQIPLMGGLLFGGIAAVLMSLLFAYQNPKTVAFVVVCAVGGGGYFFYPDFFERTHPEFDKAIASLTSLSQPKPHKEKFLREVDEEKSANTICTTREYSAAAKYDTMLVLDPTTDVIYPGALIKGETIGTGEYTPIVADRRAVTISASLENIDGSISRRVNDPKLSTVRESIKSILNQQVTGATAARNTFEIEQIHSAEQLQIAIGANYSYSSGVASVEAGFNFRTQENKSRYLLKFVQSYYTIDMDLPKTPSSLFRNAADVRLAAMGSVSPMYVSTVTYGRMALVAIESNDSSTEMEAVLKASFQSGVHSGGIDISGSHKQKLSTYKISGTIIGGSGADASAIRDVRSLLNYIDKGGNWSHESPAAPISYKLRYLSDNSVGNIVLASTYKVRDCVAIEKDVQRYRVTLKQLVCKMADDEGAANTIEVFGSIKAKSVNVSGGVSTPKSKPLWSLAGSNAHSMHPEGPASVSINASTEFAFESPDPNQSFIELSGTLTEYDSSGGSNDPLGSASTKIFVKEIASKPVSREMVFSTGHGIVHAIVVVDMIR